MSSQAAQPSEDVIHKEDIPELVYDALTDRFSDQDRRSRGCFLSQSYREIMRFVDPSDVQRIVADRKIVSHTNEIPLTGGLSDCLKAKTPEGVSVELKYDRSNVGGTPYDKYHGHLMNWFDRYDDVYDLPVRELVLRVDNQALRDQLLAVLEDSLGFNDPGEFETPFYAVMRSKSPGDALFQQVRDHHSPLPRAYFKKPTESDKRGMGWPTQTLDLVALWSHRAYTRSGNKPLGITMREIEELAFNNVETERRIYGAINSPLVINKWQRQFTAGTTDEKRWKWGETEGWVRTR
ncbi:hypothetical protein [Halococcus saccharolyticus]|uniref:Restriction endonuclease n=1 Tax=Halococcus saccharolyticus DSM 5350 TaxID=1227455 RepID=M0MQN5_9EURY|nr:hypothetical protein [Halococcus saccharolyticus]EMA47946.1 hypothetical protein C449_00700 [Halococcus saccharolyticus DSM 5350]